MLIENIYKGTEGESEMKELVLISFCVLYGTQTDGYPVCKVVNIPEVRSVDSIFSNLSYTVFNNSESSIKFVSEKKDINELVPLSFMEISEDGEDIELKKPFIVNYQRQGEYFIAENEEIHLCCWGKSLEELKEDINENLFVLFKNYVECSLSELTEDAIDLRVKLKEYF